jgi:Tfp pilus assembly protein PilO
MIWREKRALLILLAALLLGNTVFFFTYRVQYEKRLQSLDARLQEAEASLQRAHNKRKAAEQQLASYRKVQDDLQTLYNSRWATEPQRLTALINEIKRLAVASQLVPPTYSFTRVADREAGRSGIGTATVAITFTVHGSYQQIRQLINRLELSNQFVIIDGINLASGGGADVPLTLNLRLKTLFRETPRGATILNKEM